jgi:hypothetical protein
MVTKSLVLDGATEVNIWQLAQMKEILKYGIQTIVSLSKLSAVMMQELVLFHGMVQP